MIHSFTGYSGDHTHFVLAVIDAVIDGVAVATRLWYELKKSRVKVKGESQGIYMIYLNNER